MLVPPSLSPGSPVASPNPSSSRDQADAWQLGVQRRDVRGGDKHQVPLSTSLRSEIFIRWLATNSTAR